MEQKCLGCSLECEMSAPHIMTGCAYEDSPYPRDTHIWYNKAVLTCQADIDHCRDRVKNMYPDAWDKEEH